VTIQERGSKGGSNTHDVASSEWPVSDLIDIDKRGRRVFSR
jgi:hypothetical protein